MKQGLVLIRGMRLLTYILLGELLMSNLDLESPVPVADPRAYPNPSYTFHSIGQFSTECLNV